MSTESDNRVAQEEELEVLKSIYEGDQAFAVVSESRLQYKFGDDGSSRSFILEVSWPPGYPSEAAAAVSLDAFYNRHLEGAVRDRVQGAAEEEAGQNLGMAATYALFEAVRERMEELLEGQPDEEQVKQLAERLKDTQVEKAPTPSSKKEQKKEQLTKAQKRAAFKKTGTYGDEKPRGHDWVDVLRHLSQTGAKPPS